MQTVTVQYPILPNHFLYGKQNDYCHRIIIISIDYDPLLQLIFDIKIKDRLSSKKDPNKQTNIETTNLFVQSIMIKLPYHNLAPNHHFDTHSRN